MKDRTKIRAGKRIMAAILSLAMVFGIFSGMKLDAEAREGKVYKFEELTKGTVLYAGDIIDISNCEKLQWAKRGIMINDENGNKLTICDRDEAYHCKLDNITNKGVSYNTFTCVKDAVAGISGSIYVSLSVTTFEEENTETPAAPESHTCNFQWITTLDPTTGADGLEEYKCTGCGLVKESHPIPASVAAVKDFYGKVKDAPANGTVTYDSGKLYTISDYLLKKLSERSDVTVTVNFEYQNAKYELTFPAGTDYTPVLTDEETMYGYFGVAAKLGLTVAAK